MKPISSCKLLAPVCLLVLGAQGAMAQPVTASAPPASPQAVAQQVFGAMSRAIVEADPDYYKGNLASANLYTAPVLIYGDVCEAKVIHAEFSRPDMLDTFDIGKVYYASEPGSAGCSGSVANRKVFKAADAFAASSALLVLKTLIAAVTSDAPLAFPIEDQCSSHDPKCAPEGLRPRLSRIQLQDLTAVRDIARHDTDGTYNRALELNVRGGFDGHLQLQVVYQRNTDHKSSWAYEIRSVQMRWVDTRPIN